MTPLKLSSVMTFVFALSFFSLAKAQMENIQLERLITNSEQEVKSLRELIKKGEADTQILERAATVLEKISTGIDKSIEPYQGTELFTQALIQSQSSDDFSRTFSDVKTLNKLSAELESQAKIKNPKEKGNDLESVIGDIAKFQKESVKANSEDLENQSKLRNTINTAPPGFIEKVRAEIEINNWQTNTRLSAQMTEMLSVMHAIREELRLNRAKNESANPLESLIIGSDQQNEIQKGKRGDRK